MQEKRPMDADTFLALVDRHPLPWEFLDHDEGCRPSSPIYIAGAELTGLELRQAQELADSAPALAAAAIRLLRDAEMTSADSCMACERLNPDVGPIDHKKECALIALRAALPENLRP
jgi:hypothetical protein